VTRSASRRPRLGRYEHVVSSAQSVDFREDRFHAFGVATDRFQEYTAPDPPNGDLLARQAKFLGLPDRLAAVMHE
jgi:hypothetical protein